MKKSLYIFLYLVFSGIPSHSQEYFNNRYNISGQWLWDYATTILSVNDRYIIGAETGSEDNFFRRRISLCELDTYGNVQDIKFYGDTGVSFGAGYPGFLILTSDSLFTLSGVVTSNYPGWVRNEGLLMRMNKHLDTIWTKRYGDIIEPCDSGYIFRQLISADNKDYVIIGSFMCSIDNRPQNYVVRTDSSGNILWNKWPGDTIGLYYPSCISATSDDGFVMTGTRSSGGVQTIDPVIFKLDSLGNTEWYKNIGSPFLDPKPFVDKTNDGNIIVGTIISDSSLSTDLFYGRIYYLKLDNEGNVIWEKKYGKSQIGNRLWSIKALDNGNIISTGSRIRWYPETPFKIGWMLCANSEGDSLWYREYIFLSGKDSDNFLYDIAQTHDSGFIACGYVYPVSPDTGTQDTWIIKVDSIGCESLEYCWTAIEEPEIKPVEKGKLTAFPNPVTNRITFEIVGEELMAGSTLTVYDHFGRVFHHDEFVTAAVFWKLDVSSWPGGLYIARLVFMNEVVGNVKFVVTK